MGTISGGKPYVKWNDIGDKVEGRITSIELSKSSRGGKMLHMVNSDGEAFMVSAPTLLAEMVESHFDMLEGEPVTITFVEQDSPQRAGESGLMRFKIDYPDDAEKKEKSKRRSRT